MARTNGGEISLIEYLKEIQARGVSVTVASVLATEEKAAAESFLRAEQCPLQSDDTYSVDGLSCRVVWESRVHPHDESKQGLYEKRFNEIIESENPNYILVHYTDFFSVSAAMKWDPGRTFVMFTDNEFPRFERMKEFVGLASAYASIKNALVASPFMKEQVEASFSNSRVRLLPNLMPHLDSAKPCAGGPYLGFVNPVPEKGLEFMLELAAQLKNEDFLFIGNWTGQPPKQLPKNIWFKGRQRNFFETLKDMQMLLVPSRWEEGFGRVCLEAMAAGVPVIASPRGNLPRTLGGAGLIVPLESAAWIQAIQDIRANSAKFVGLGLQRVQDFREESKRAFDEFFRSL